MQEKKAADGARIKKDTGRVTRPFDRLRVTEMRLLRYARNDRGR